jgi:hypothetical protein
MRRHSDAAVRGERRFEEPLMMPISTRPTAPGTEVLATLLRAMRSGAHFTSLLLGGCALGVFYVALFHLRLVAAALPLVGRHTVMTLFMPVGLAQLALVAWLAAKGFVEQAVPAEVVR